MSSRSKVTHAIQVFPFLAVLVCTMGALIFLLLLMTRQVRQRELAFAEEEQAQRDLANAAAALLPPTPTPEAEPAEQPVSQIVVLPPQPPRKQKPVKLPDECYALTLAERERELDELTTKWKVKTQKLQTERERKKKTLRHRKKLIDSAVAQTTAIKTDVEKLEGELEGIEGDATESANEKEEAERRQIQQQIVEMKRKLRAAQAADANPENDKFQVVPFDAQTGTTRRPILIECTGHGIRFLPENITITPADLEGFTPRVNPLAAGTGALINYWNEWNAKQRNPKKEPEPYPLLLVRPDGVVAYYIAMKYLEPIRTTHGYELIDESTTLQLPDVDPVAKAVCQSAIERLVAERENVSRVAVNSGAGASVFGGAPRRGGGKGGAGRGRGSGGATGDNGTNGSSGNGGRVGAVGVGGGKGGNSASGESAGGDGAGGAVLAGGTSPNRSSDGRSSGRSVFTMSDLDGGDENVGDRSWERIENFEGRSRPRKVGELAGGIDDGPGGYPQGSLSGRGKGNAANGSSIRPSGMAGPEGSQGSLGSDGTLAMTGGGNPSARATGGSGKGVAGDSESIESDLPSPISPTVESSGASSGGTNVFGMTPFGSNSTGGNLSGANASGTNTSGGNPPGGNSVGGSTSGANSAGQNGSGTGMSGGMAGGDGAAIGPQGSANGSANSGRRRSNVQSGTSGRMAPNNGPSNNNFGDYGEPEPGMPIGKRPGSKASSGNGTSDDSWSGSDEDGGTAERSGSRSGSRSGGSSGRAGISDNDSSPPRNSRGSRLSSDTSRPSSKRNKSNEPEKQLEPEMLSGRHWGVSDSGASIGLEREVRVDVMSDKLVIAEKYEIPVGLGETRQETFELFVTSLDRCSREWGRPPQGFFWTPRVNFVVKPEGSSQYEQVNTMMRRAGLSTSHEFAKSSDTVEFGRDLETGKKPVAKSGRKTSAGGVQ